MTETGFLTLSNVAQSPNLYTHTFNLQSGEKLIFRPLKTNDIQGLTKFLEGLSSETRKLSTFSSFDVVTAQEFCDAINKYDKLRFIVETIKGKIVALLEFSFGIPKDDFERFNKYGESLNEQTDCRFGPTLADDYQNQGIGSLIFQYIVEITKKFGKKRIILYGGVLGENVRAIHFYKKHGFHIAGEFDNSESKHMIDMILNLTK